MSEEADQSQKTEEPSERKLKKSREEGKIFISKELSAFLSFLVFTLLLAYVAPWAAKRISGTLGVFFTPNIMLSANLWNAIQNIIKAVSIPFLIPLFFLLMIGILSPYLQRGSVYSTKVLKPDIKRISPIAGFKRIFSLNSVIEMLKGMVKIILVGYAVYSTVKPDLVYINNAINLESYAITKLLLAIIVKMMITVCIIMFFLGIGDYIYQRRNYLNKMKMTKQELKEEHKKYEGQPEVKSKQKSIRIQRARNSIMLAMPKADVVIANPTHYAVALKYDLELMPAPQVIAKGEDELALEIRRLAKKYKIPIVENKTLAKTLYSAVKINDLIPFKYYRAVAEVISYVMKLNRNKL